MVDLVGERKEEKKKKRGEKRIEGAVDGSSACRPAWVTRIRG